MLQLSHLGVVKVDLNIGVEEAQTLGGRAIVSSSVAVACLPRRMTIGSGQRGPPTTTA
jgi:hypothetical protein